MKKEGLFDCCGAKHINQFQMRPSQLTNITAWDPNRHVNITVNVTALQALELFSAPSGLLDVPGTKYKYNNQSPGLLTCILRRDQHHTWKPHLERLGWQLVVNNIQNSNSGNQLFFWVKISRPVPNRTHTFRFVADQAPYTGMVRDLGGGRYARCRRAPGAPLEEIERVDRSFANGRSDLGTAVEPLLVGAA